MLETLKKNKKILVIAGVVLIPFVLIVISQFSISTSSTQESTSPTSNQKTGYPVMRVTEESPISPAPQSDMNIYQGSEYTTYYPKDWIKNETSDEKGTVMYFEPAKTPEISPHIIIQAADASQTSLDKMTAGFTIFAYRVTSTRVSGVPAQKFDRVLDSPQGPLHSIAYVFPARGKIYMLKLGYTQDVINPELENEFNQVVNNFSVH